MTAPSRATFTTTADRAALTFTVERVFAASRERVFGAFAHCDALRQWWSPADWTMPVCQQDFRVGGTWLYLMQGPDGTQAWGKQVYEEITAPERIIAIDLFVDAEGTQLQGMPVLRTRYDLIAEAGRTRLRNVTHFDTLEDLETVIRMGMEEGVASSWDKLDAWLVA